MVTFSTPQRLTLPPTLTLPTLGAVAAGGCVALAFLVMPSSLLEGLVSASGVPAVIAAAEPPLGLTARVALALLGGGACAGFAWLALYLAFGQRTVTPSDFAALLRVRKPTEPPRPPLFANRDLGTPFLDVKAAAPVRHFAAEDFDPAPLPIAVPIERALPLDLDQPLAAFDPAAILDLPLAPSAPVAPLAAPKPVESPYPAQTAPPSRPQLIDPGDRFETFELTPLARTPPVSLRVAASEAALEPRQPETTPPPSEPVVGAQTETSIQAMLARLESGLAKRTTHEVVAQPRRHTLEDTLGDLRRLATAR